MSTKVASLYAEITAKTDGLKAGIDSAKGQLGNMKASFNDLKMSALAVSGVLIGVGIAAKEIYEIGKEGAQLELVEGRFDRLSDSIGTTSDVLLNDLKDATSGMMSDATLMASATDLMALGLVKTHDEAVRLTSVAGQLGMNMNQLVLTLTNQTTMRFDALGVSVDGFDEKVKALEATGMSANDAFNEAFLQQAEEQLEKVGGMAETSAGQIAMMEAAWGNFTDTAKMQIAPVVAKVATGLTEQMNLSMKLREALEKGIVTEREAAKIGHQVETGYLERADALEYVNEKMDYYNLKQDEAVHMLGPYQQGMQYATEATKALAESYDKITATNFIATAEDIAAATAAMRDRAKEATDNYNNLGTSLKGVDFSEDADAQLAFYERLRETGAMTEEQYKGLTKTVNIESGKATEASYALGDAQTMAQTMMLEGLKLTSGEIALLPGILEGVAADGTASMGELEAAFITAGLTTQEEIDKINQIDLTEATTTISNLATSLTNIPDEEVIIHVVPDDPWGLLGRGSRWTGGGKSDSGTGRDFANGGSFVIPPGYNNDSFYLGAGNFAQSGEKVTVTPAGQSNTPAPTIPFDYDRLGRVIVQQMQKSGLVS